MADVRDVAVLVGSLRKGSLTTKLVHAMKKFGPQSLALDIVEIRELALYDADLEAEGTPAPWLAFRERVGKADAVLFATPEYNRSVPGALKNAIDVGSRPPGRSVFSGKPAAVLSVSQGLMGGFGANHHLRQMLVFLDMPTMAQPEAYIGKLGELFDAEGKIAQPATHDFLTAFLVSFAAWIETTRKQ